MTKTLQIRFQCQKAPDSQEIEEKEAKAEPGEKLTQVAFRAGVVIQQTCGGTPSCTDCRIVVKEEGAEAFEAPQGPEIRLIGNVYFINHERLACQSIVKNDATVYVPSPAAARRAQKIFRKPSKGVNRNGQEKEKTNEKNSEKNPGFKKEANKKSRF